DARLGVEGNRPAGATGEALGAVAALGRAQALGLVEDHGAGLGIDGDGALGAGVHAGGVAALVAQHRELNAGVELVDAHARSRWPDLAVLMELRAGDLAQAAAGAFVEVAPDVGD